MKTNKKQQKQVAQGRELVYNDIHNQAKWDNYVKFQKGEKKRYGTLYL